jgi:hypothetical protein
MQYLAFSLVESDEMSEPPSVMTESHILAHLPVLPHPVHGGYLRIECIQVVDVLTLHISVVPFEQAENIILCQSIFLYLTIIMIGNPYL